MIDIQLDFQAVHFRTFTPDWFAPRKIRIIWEYSKKLF